VAVGIADDVNARVDGFRVWLVGLSEAFDELGVDSLDMPRIG
jgi:hypothetical protein